MRHDVVVVGSINVDLVLSVPRHPRPGETLLGEGGALFAGGKGANQAVAAARRGASTALVGAVGTDGNVTTALAELAEAGVDLAAVATVPGPTGLAVVTLAADGENTIVVVPGANAAVSPEAVDLAAATIGAASVVVLQAEIPTASVERAVEVAAAAGARVVLNLAPATSLPLATLVRADPLVVNEHELALVLRSLDGPPTRVPAAAGPGGGHGDAHGDGHGHGGGGGDGDGQGKGHGHGVVHGDAQGTASGAAGGDASGAAGGDASAAAGGDTRCDTGDERGGSVGAALDGARVLRDWGVRSVVVTLGTAGVVGVDDSGEWKEPARPVQARDTTGAGDAFVGALAERLAHGATLHDAAAVATRVAAYAVQRLGAQASYPWKDDPLP